MKKIELMRSHFIRNSLGEDEFDWYLSELGVPEEKRGDKMNKKEFRIKVCGGCCYCNRLDLAEGRECCMLNRSHPFRSMWRRGEPEINIKEGLCNKRKRNF